MIGFFENQYLSYKKDHIKSLMALAKADGFVHEKERGVIFKIGKRYGLKERQIKTIMESNEKFKAYRRVRGDVSNPSFSAVFATSMQPQLPLRAASNSRLGRFGGGEAIPEKIFLLFWRLCRQNRRKTPALGQSPKDFDAALNCL